jgi:uncharacterized heparinase superfamily protein
MPPPHEERSFLAFGEERRFDSPGFWTDESQGLLFLFHLHGFRPLAAYAGGPGTAEGDAFWSEVIDQWLTTAGNPGLPGWHPYPTSLRVISWSAALSGMGGWPDGLREGVVAEVWRQARYLSRAVEHDIGGNHVIKNATALAVAGSVFPDSSLLETAHRLLRRELERQVLSDGGHEERSTSYHREVVGDLEDVVTCTLRSRGTVPGWLTHAVGEMRTWQAKMTGPDGTLPLLNDAWEGPVADRQAGTTDHGSVDDLAGTGYVVMRDRGDQLVFDAGPVSPDHLPPHAHADVLSFVLWADGRAVIADPGSYAYTGEWRDAFRRTAAHNTVEVDGASQCEFWGDFRAAFRPNVSPARVRRHGPTVVATASHDGYRRLPDPVVHHRSIVWWPPAGVVVVDLLRARRTHSIRSSLRLAPGTEVDVVHRAGPFAVEALGSRSAVRRVPARYAPNLGTMVSIGALEDRRQVGPDSPFGWSLLREGHRVASLERSLLVLEGAGREQRAIPLDWD